MKQHMLTHKIRDMPQHMFENKLSTSGDEAPPPPQLPTTQREPPIQVPESEPPLPPPPPPQPSISEQSKEQTVKREPTETELPLPKRPPSEYHSFDYLVSISFK